MQQVLHVPTQQLIALYGTSVKGSEFRTLVAKALFHRWEVGGKVDVAAESFCAEMLSQVN